jgi:AmiR/NasT family two-component response regulator
MRLKMENLIGISIIAIALAFIVLLISNRNLIATISIIIIVFVSYTTTVRIENVIDEGFMNVVTSPIIMETDENRPQFGRL